MSADSSGAPDVAIVRTGIANLASVMAGLRRAGAAPRVTEDPDDVRAARCVVLPGVGAFGSAVDRLDRLGLRDVLVERVREGRPTLAVCLGLQLLLAGSDESPSAAGLGVCPGRATRFSGSERVRVPQLGWNRVETDPTCELLAAGHFFFANSYRLEERPAGFACGTADHGGPFVAALERGALLACQFHPELSGQRGLDLLRRWLARSSAAGGTEAATC